MKLVLFGRRCAATGVVLFLLRASCCCDAEMLSCSNADFVCYTYRSLLQMSPRERLDSLRIVVEARFHSRRESKPQHQGDNLALEPIWFDCTFFALRAVDLFLRRLLLLDLSVSSGANPRKSRLTTKWSNVRSTTLHQKNLLRQGDSFERLLYFLVARFVDSFARWQKANDTALRS